MGGHKHTELEVFSFTVHDTVPWEIFDGAKFSGNASIETLQKKFSQFLFSLNV